MDRINVRSDLSFIPEDVTKLNQHVLKDERGLNREVDFTQAFDRLPDFSYEKIAPKKFTFDLIVAEVDQVLAGF